MAAYSVEPFKDDTEKYPVVQFLDELESQKDRASLLSAIEILKELGPDALKMKAFKKFNDHLFEITKGDCRIIYLRDGNHFELLHGFPKNSQKTYRRDKIAAEDRFSEYWRRKNK